MIIAADVKRREKWAAEERAKRKRKKPVERRNTSVLF
jgi:hypothetical protein